LHASELTLITVNWNGRPSLELLFKSYIEHHFDGGQLPALVLDNGSTDDSVEWLRENDVPHFCSETNLGHMPGVNLILEKYRLQKVLLVDSDVRFDRRVTHLIDAGSAPTVCANIIPAAVNATTLKSWPARIDPSRCYFDWPELVQQGITKFDEPIYCADSGTHLLNECLKRLIPVPSFPEGTYHYQLTSYDSSGQLPDRQKILHGRIAEDAKKYSSTHIRGRFRAPPLMEAA